MPQLRTANRRTYEVPARLLGVGVVVFASLAIFGTACERATRQKTLPLLTTTSEVRRLSLADVSRGYPVRLRGIATYYHAPSTSLVLQTGADGILIDASQIKAPIAAGRDIEIVGVQSEGYPLWPRVLEAGGPVSVTPHTIADGTTAPFNPAMFTLLRELVDRWVLVPEASVRAAVRELAATVKVVAEGAGALGYAALKLEPRGSVSAAIVSGGNIDLTLLRDILAEDPDSGTSAPPTA